MIIIKYIPLQQGLRLKASCVLPPLAIIIKYIPLQQGLRHTNVANINNNTIIKYIPLQQGLRQYHD